MITGLRSPPYAGFTCARNGNEMAMSEKATLKAQSREEVFFMLDPSKLKVEAEPIDSSPRVNWRLWDELVTGTSKKPLQQPGIGGCATGLPRFFWHGISTGLLPKSL
jgi:hypothetical protein